MSLIDFLGGAEYSSVEMASSIVSNLSAGEGDKSEIRPIPDTASVSAHESVLDFVVLPESPGGGYLSEAGDAFDNLAVQLQSLPMASAVVPVQSVSLRADIERLTTENEQLKKAALDNSQSMKIHLERCNVWREQMQRIYERDAAMIEEARQTTIKMQEEKATLRACLESTQKKLEDAIVEKFSLSEMKKSLEEELRELRSQLDECHQKLEESNQRVEDLTYVYVDSEESAKQYGSEKEVLRKKTQDKPEKVKKERDVITKQPDERDTPEENPVVASLQTEIASLKVEVEKTSNEVKEMTSRYAQLTALISEKESELTELRAQLAASITDKESCVEKLQSEYDDLLKQMSLKKAAFDAQRERKIQELNARICFLEKEVQQGRRDGIALQNAEAALLKAAAEREIDILKLSNANSEAKALRAESQSLRDERDALRAACEQVNAYVSELNVLKQREAAFKLLQNDQASQIEAFKEEWRKEHIIRLKWENDYKELLQTWQAFEQDQPVIIGAESAESNQIDQRAVELMHAERLRLEETVRSQQQEISNLRAQNMQLMTDKLISIPQQPSRTFTTADFCCPLCSKAFTDQATLIHHAGLCNPDEEGGP
ncbi:myosin heavy chain, embryonic smooth muscle isoform-like isoform X2 [Varroa jacobsoni]|uniref:myosin heavy chain, embryonic smooth muscle isoform-like isoform X2 n=1 Tax=Varroa jacobsoni TaxID=62625 RepID=UPI000BF6D35B|nr:myosin heavy chain, embryonic smooth muscle isoform-like isoform X2 [Varroa jacobsoni]